MSNIIRRRSIHAGKLERWLGADKIDKLVGDMRGWYGPPINIRDVPGSVWITGDGDFVGDFGRGAFASALDNLRDHLKQFWARVERERAFREHAFGVGFTVARTSRFATSGPLSRKPPARSSAIRFASSRIRVSALGSFDSGLMSRAILTVMS